MNWLRRIFTRSPFVRCAWCGREVPRGQALPYGLTFCCSEAHLLEYRDSQAW